MNVFNKIRFIIQYFNILLHVSLLIGILSTVIIFLIKIYESFNTFKLLVFIFIILLFSVAWNIIRFSVWERSLTIKIILLLLGLFKVILLNHIIKV
jgi:hypothetical protein